VTIEFENIVIPGWFDEISSDRTSYQYLSVSINSPRNIDGCQFGTWILTWLHCKYI
jgi:hypothetical protein